MSIFKHPDSGIWYVDIVLPNGKRVKRSTRNKDKKAAQEYHDKVKAESWRIEHLGDKPEHLFDEAAVMYLKSCAGLRDYRSKVSQMRYWVQCFKGQTIRSLTTDIIMDAVPENKRVQSGGPLPMNPATKNRYLATLSKLLNLCVNRGWLDAAPKILKFKEAEIRESFMTVEQAQTFLGVMAEGWMKEVCRFALATGMRAGEILSLEWRHVDVARKTAAVTAANAKSGSGRAVPLNFDAMGVILSRYGKHDKFVFARVDSATAEVDRRTFKRAVKDAGLPETFRFHDLRHTWASFHAQAGTSALVLQQLGGWKTLAMLNRYAHFNMESLREFVENSALNSAPKPRLTLVS
jgi:integrase